MERPVLLALAMGACAHTPPAAPTPETAPLDAPLPVDPSVRTGVLDNGLHWYIEVNQVPESRAVLRLAVDAGAVLEDDDQRGVAHFVEHMAFNGTRSFAGNELIAYLGSVGARFGAHVNAHTSFEETVYKLTVPTDDPEVFDTAFTVLADWADGLTFDPIELEKERGVVIEEWRASVGAGERIFRQTLPLVYDAGYAERLPIGTPESLASFEPAAARQFYDDWYRPDLMAVIVVGDIDPDAVQATIEERLGRLPPAAETARERFELEIPAHDDTRYAVIPDPEVPATALQVLAKVDMPQLKTHRDYRQSLLARVALAVVNERLWERSQQPDAPFLGAMAGRQRLSPTEGAWTLAASVPDGGVLPAYEAVLTEVERIRRYGVRAGELERAQAAVQSFYDGLLAELDKTASVHHADEIVRVYLTGESMPGTAYEVGLATRFVPSITAAEVSEWLRTTWMPPSSRVVLAVVPERDGVEPPTVASLAEIEARVVAADVAPPPSDDAVPPLLEVLPAPGRIVDVDDRFVNNLGFTGWTLSNGARVWWRRTDFKDDQVLLSAWRSGGTSVLSDDDFVTGTLAPEVVARSGLGTLGPDDIPKWLAGRSVMARQYLTETHAIVAGRATAGDVEAALQLLHASFVAPRITPTGIALLRTQLTEQLRNQQQSPDHAFGRAKAELLWPDDRRRRPWTLDMLDELRDDRLLELYQDQFGTADGWTFVLVGNLPEDLEPLITRYLASIPGGDGAPGWVDRGFRPTPWSVQQVVHHGSDPKARVVLDYHGPFEGNATSRYRLRATASILGELLRNELREARSGVYGVGVNPIDHHPFDHYTLSIAFTCDPERVDELVAATEAIVARLRTEGPPESVVAQEKEQRRRDRELRLTSNGFWLTAISSALQWGEDPTEILSWDDRNRSLSVEVVRETAAALLSGEHRAKVVLLPED